MSRVSTISAEEQQMALTEKEFSMIKKKMDKIDHHLNEMYKNWHVEYGNTNTLEECKEIKNFYKPCLGKYESKYRVLYHLLQKPRLIPTHDGASGITPSLAVLDDATSLKWREWIRSEPGEDIPQQYSSIEGHLTPHTPRSEDMKLEPSLNLTPEGSLVNIPTVVRRETREQVPEREKLETSSETAYMEFPNTQVKTIPMDPVSGVPKSLKGTKEASRVEALASTQQFFATVDQRNMNIPARNQITSAKVHERDNIEVPDISTTTVVTTSVTTPPIPLDVELIGTSTPRISLPEGSPSHPTVTATCRPRTWMQQLTEGQITEPRRGDASSSESNTSVVETLPEEIPDELGHEWRVLHLFDLPGVRFPTDTMPPNQRRLAENHALVELIRTTEYLDDVPTWGQRDYRLYPPQYGDPFYRGRGRGRSRGGRGRREWLQERQMERPNGGFGRGNGRDNNMRPQQQALTDRPQPARQEDEWSLPPTVERRDDAERWQTTQLSPPAALPLTEERLFTNWSSEGSPRERVNQQIQLASRLKSRRTTNQMEQTVREPGDNEVLRYVLSDVTTTPSAQIQISQVGARFIDCKTNTSEVEVRPPREEARTDMIHAHSQGIQVSSSSSEFSSHNRNIEESMVRPCIPTMMPQLDGPASVRVK